MKFFVAKEHRDFFLQTGYIQFEDLMKKNELDELNQLIKKHFAKSSPNEIFFHGRDLWRKEALFKKLVTRKRFAEIASALSKEKALRLGFDQLLVNTHPTYRLNREEDPYSHWLEKDKTLSDISCFQGVNSGLLLCLDSSGEEKNSLFCSTPGSGVFFSKETLVPLHELLSKEERSFLLIVYLEFNALYTLKTEDLHTHELKELGYVYGDRLKDKTHPVLFK